MTAQTEKLTPVPYLDLPAQIRSIRKELDAALRWACSTVLAAEQQAEIKRRAVDRARISNDAALENMFAAVGVGRENIIKNEKTGGRDAPF